MKDKKSKPTVQERIAKYLEAVPPAIAYSRGHDQTFKVACSLCNGWNLSEEDTLAWLRIYNQRCQPPWTDKELAHKAAEAARAKHNKPRGHLLDASIEQQRAEPDWTLPSKPIASGKIPATLATLNSNLRVRAYNANRQPRDYFPFHAYARSSETNVANVAKREDLPLVGPKIDQRPTDKTATDLVGKLRRFKADGSSAPATAPVEPSEMPGGVITKHDSHVAADPPQQDVIVSHSNPDPVASAVVLAQAAQLAKPGFRADATHLELALRNAVSRRGHPLGSEGASKSPRGHSRLKRHGRPDRSETTDRGNDVCRPNSGAEEPQTQSGESDVNPDAEARRIAAELVKLHEAGAIKSEQDASFYANLVHLFGAGFTARGEAACV